MKSPFVSFGILGLSLVIGIFFTWPAYQKYGQLKDQLQMKNDELQTRQRYFKNLADLKTKLTTYQTQLDKLNAALPADPSLPSLYNEIGAIAATSGYVLKEIGSSVEPKNDSASVRKTDVRLVLVGRYDGLKDFILKAQNASRPLEISSVSFKASKVAEQFSPELHVTAYSY